MVRCKKKYSFARLSAGTAAWTRMMLECRATVAVASATGPTIAVTHLGALATGSQTTTGVLQSNSSCGFKVLSLIPALHEC